MTLFEAVISKIKLLQEISSCHADFLNSFPKGSSQQSKNKINVFSDPKWPSSHQTLLLLYTHLIVDREWEMSLLKTDTLFKLINK